MGRWVQILCVFNIIFIICSAEEQINFNDDKARNLQTYDLNALFTKHLQRMESYHQLKNNPMNIQINSISENLANLQLEKLLWNSSKCLRDLLYTAENLKNFSNTWALKMLDSYGKPESGILEGNFRWLGDYTECTKIYVPINSDAMAGDFHGQYCFLASTFTIKNTSLTLTNGVCIPDSCSILQIPVNIMNGLIPVGTSDKYAAPKSISLDCKPTERHLNTPAIAVIVLMSLFCALVVIASSVTAVKYFMNTIKESRGSSIIVSSTFTEIGGDEKKNSDSNLLLPSQTPQGPLKKLQPFLDSFCALKNGLKLLNTDTREGELLCIHGIRFLSMSWVILGHSYLFCIQETRNVPQVLDLVNNFPFQIVINGTYSVDSFFVLSGFLLAYLSMQEFSKTDGKISWVYFYIHRYIRLTPVYMIVLAFSATVYLYLGDGPFWPTNNLDPICRDYWWWNLLYINNFSKMTEQCMGWSWYLANDMQFFVISPLFLITLWRWPKVGYSLLGIFICSCWISNFVITYHFDILAGLFNFINLPVTEIMEKVLNLSDYFEKLYIKPYTRIAPYLMGMLVGYIVFERKRSNKPKHDLDGWPSAISKVHESLSNMANHDITQKTYHAIRVILCVGWMLASTITLASVYGMYNQNPGVVGRSFFNALSRSSFSVGLCWVIYVCLTDQGGFVNRILSYRLFIPLSRLTYSAYLIHPMIITGYYASLKTAFDLSHPTVVLLFLGMMVVTYGLSVPVSLVFESPIMSLEKTVRNKFRKQQVNMSTN